MNKNVNDLEVMSMTELYDTAFTPRSKIIDGLLNCGTYIFSGAPKIGKSFLVLQMAYCVSTGTPFWDYKVTQGDVLYLALEDNYPRLQERLSRMFGDAASENLYLSIRAGTIHEGLTEQIRSFIKGHTDTKLVIIDTLQKIREGQDERSSYSCDYENINSLKVLSDEKNICIITVHHTRKMESPDSFAMISGTNGLLGAADAGFVMQKDKRTENTAVLDIVGRDQSDQKLIIKRDPVTCLWSKESEEVEKLPEIHDEVLELISGFMNGGSLSEWTGSASDLIRRCPELGEVIKPNVLTRKLNISCGRLFGQYGIIYTPEPRKSDKRTFTLCRKDCSMTVNDDNDDISGTVSDI